MNDTMYVITITIKLSFSESTIGNSIKSFNNGKTNGSKKQYNDKQ